MIKNKRDVYSKLGVSFVEKIPEANRVLTPKTNYAFEIIKFVVFNLIVVFFILMSRSQGTWLESFYKYSIGLLFGNLIYLFAVIGYMYFCISFFSYFTKNKSFAHFNRLRKTNINVIKKNYFILLMCLFLVLSLSLHIAYYFKFNSAFSFDPTPENLKSLFVNGWYARFTIDGPNVNNNIGFMLDSIYNILYYPTLSPILPIIVILLIIAFAIWQLLFNGTKNFFKYYSFKLPITKLIKNMSHRNSTYYLTIEIQMYFEFLIQSGRELKIKYEDISFKDLEKQVFLNIDKLNYDLTFEKLKGYTTQEVESDISKYQTKNIILETIAFERKNSYIQIDEENVKNDANLKSKDDVFYDEESPTYIKLIKNDLKTKDISTLTKDELESSLVKEEKKVDFIEKPAEILTKNEDKESDLKLLEENEDSWFVELDDTQEISNEKISNTKEIKQSNLKSKSQEIKLTQETNKNDVIDKPVGELDEIDNKIFAKKSEITFEQNDNEDNTYTKNNIDQMEKFLDKVFIGDKKDKND
ncbi:hypothetical protein [Mycoplasma crocodyli]|nr:hypothetical protein [Mycoplasma crocodyli]